MRVALLKSSGRIIESQTNDEASLDILLANANASGYDMEDVDVKIIPDAEFFPLMQAQIDSEKTYAEKRAAAYPSTGDQLDAIWKAITALTEGHPLPSDATDLLTAIEATKAQFPK